MILRIGGLPLHVRRDGRGPVCVLSSGLGGSWFDWDPVMPLLTPYRTVVRFDRPGYGLSAPSQPAPTAAGEAERIHLVLAALDLPGRCTVAGYSLSSFYVEAFARLYPEQVAGLVLLDGSTEPDPDPLPAPELRDLAARAFARALSGLAVPYLFGPAGRRLVVRLNTVRREDPAPADLVQRCYRPSRALRAMLRENTSYLDVAAELAELRRREPLPPIPVAVLAADRGRRSRHGRRWNKAQRRLAELLGAEFRVAVPAGHLVMFDRPSDVASAILDLPRAGR